MLNYSRAVANADWITRSGTDPDRLINYGPAGFDAYARVRFLPDPAFVGQAEADAPCDPSRPSRLDYLVAAVDVLVPFTSSPDRGYFCVWDSGAMRASPIPRSHAFVDVPLRRSFLVEGQLSELCGRYEDLQLDPYDHPSLIWPADHAWCIGTDVDPHWAGVGASVAAIEYLLEMPGLDCVAADPDAPPVRYDRVPRC